MHNLRSTTGQRTGRECSEQTHPGDVRVRLLLRPIRDWFSIRATALAKTVATDEGWGRLSHTLGAPSMLHGLLSLRDKGVDLRAVIDGGRALAIGLAC